MGMPLPVSPECNLGRLHTVRGYMHLSQWHPASYMHSSNPLMEEAPCASPRQEAMHASDAKFLSGLQCQRLHALGCVSHSIMHCANLFLKAALWAYACMLLPVGHACTSQTTFLLLLMRGYVY